jgi:hypothetical protein
MEDEDLRRRGRRITRTKAIVQHFYQKYKDAILFNKNLLIADTCSLFASAFLAQLYLELVSSSYIANSIFTALVEYCIDTPIFLLLYYIDNRHKYIIQDFYSSVGRRKKEKDTSKIKSDIKRLLCAFSLCDIMYIIIKIFVQYQLLEQTKLQPYQAAMFSSLIGWAAFIILINITMRAIKVFNKNELIWYYGIILSISISNSVIFFCSLDVKTLYDNIILDSTAAIAVCTILIVLFRQRREQHGREKKLMLESVHSDATNRLFTSLAAGLILWFAAEVIWAYYQVWLGIDNPFPSIADALWLIGYGFFIYHLYKVFNLIRIRTTTAAASTHNYRHLLISVIVIVVIASSYIVSIFIFSTSSNSNPFNGQPHKNEDIIGFLISIAYPVLDGIILVPAATILWSLRRADPAFTHWILISTFIIMVTIGDVGFGYSEVIINEEIAQKELWIWDTFYNAGYICIAAALLWYNKFSIVIPLAANKQEKEGGRNL